jgi:diguanylate cyclase (GGDEF)-like protein/PAS domain S-box-containing protein
MSETNHDHIIPPELERVDDIEKLETACGYIDSENTDERSLCKGLIRAVINNLKMTEPPDARLYGPGDEVLIGADPLLTQEEYDYWAMEIFGQMRQSSYDGMFITGDDSEILPINRAMEIITGFSQEELLRQRLVDLVFPDDISLLDEIMDERDMNDHQPVELRIINKQKETRWVRLKSYLINTTNDEVPGKIAWTMWDITEMIELSRVDSLTGLKNKRALEEKFESLRHSREISRKTPLSIVTIDIDDFKQYNDIYGHAEGDAVLRWVATMLRVATRRESDFIARSGGDEFIIPLLMTDYKSAQGLIKRIRETFDGYNMINPDRPINVSIGVSTARSPGELDEKIKRSDVMLYREKKRKNPKKQAAA